jgi:hypothetical protein
MPGLPHSAAALLLVAFLPAALPAAAANDEFKLVIQGHAFQPAELVVPAATKIRLVVENRDTTPEEFESPALNREKVIAGKSTATIFIGPLKPGSYPFAGEYHESTAKGVIIAR